MIGYLIDRGVYHMKSQITDEIKKLKQIRLSLNWSQQELSSELGVGIITLSRWESGKNIPGNIMLEKIIKPFIKKYNKYKQK